MFLFNYLDTLPKLCQWLIAYWASLGFRGIIKSLMKIWELCWTPVKWLAHEPISNLNTVEMWSKLHSAKKPVTTMLTYPWKCTVLHCNHLGNTWKPLVLMTRHFDYCPSASEGDNQSVRSSAPVVSRCFPGGYNVKLYISRGRLAWWLLAFLNSACTENTNPPMIYQFVAVCG